MGLFSDLFGSSSHSSSTSSTSNVTNTQLAGGNIGGPAVYGSGNYIRTTQTDQGAVLAATDVSRAALDLGAFETAAGTSVAIAGLDHARDANTSSLALVGDVTRTSLNNDYSLAAGVSGGAYNLAGGVAGGAYNLAGGAFDFAGGLAGGAFTAAAGTNDAISNFAGKALDSVTRFGRQSLDSNTYIAGKSLDALSQAYSDSLSQVGRFNQGALATVEGLASQVAQSSQQTTDTTVQKIVVAMVIAVAAIFVLPAIARAR